MKPKNLSSINRAAYFAALTLAGTSAGTAQLASQYGILDVTANGGINPNTGAAWVIGDQYRLAFHTLGVIDATSNDPAVYDAFATAQAQENPALATSTGWTAMVWINTDGSLDQNIQTGTNANGDPVFGLNPDMPLSSPLVRSGTDDFSDGANQGGAGVPVYAMDGTTAIARNNNDIYNSWSNPFESGLAVIQADGTGNNVQRVSGVFYSPFLDQNGNQTVNPDANHGKTTWTGGFTNPVNPLGDTTNEVRSSNGNTNPNNPGRVWNRFQADNTASLGVYAISELLTIGTGTPAVPLVLGIASAVDPETGFDLEWPSKDGKFYRIRSNATLDTAPATWTVVLEDIASDGETTSINVTPTETKLFYVVEEYDAPDPE